jgi:hypothetical protein
MRPLYQQTRSAPHINGRGKVSHEEIKNELEGVLGRVA